MTLPNDRPSDSPDQAISVNRGVPAPVGALSHEMAGVSNLLEVRGVDFSYGQLQVLFDVDLDLRQGEVLALLGTNGAGKSTLLRAITGLGFPDAGAVVFDGVDITHEEPHRRVERGLVQVPGGKAIFPGLSVAENLRLGGFRLDDRIFAERREMVLELFPVLRDRLRQQADTLSGGERQMLAIAKGLLLDPRCLCIDELSLGLAPVVVEQLIGVVAELKARGITMIIVEQSVNVALSLADRAVFMEKGQVRFEGASRDLLERDDLVRAVFLGGAR
jgi:ABC-type branched-subunit amino acid transport system ATPase component